LSLLRDVTACASVGIVTVDAYAKDGVECLKGGAGMISDLVEVELEKFATKNNELTQNHAGWKQLTLGG